MHSDKVNPLVSIIVPVYNIAGQISQCINSLLKQTYSNIEIILVNDGSTDNSGIILDKLKVKDNRIKVIHTKNGGVTTARKKGWETSTGEYCLFVDGDDSLTDDAIEYFIRIFNSGDYDFVSGYYDIVYDNGNVKAQTPSLVGEYDTQTYIFETLRKTKGFPSIWIGMFKASLFDNAIFDIDRKFNRGEDALTVIGLLNNIQKIYCSDKVFYHYYQRIDSVTHTVKITPEYLIDLSEMLVQRFKDEYKPFVYPVRQCTYLRSYYSIVERDGWNESNQQLRKNILKGHLCFLSNQLNFRDRLKYCALRYKWAVIILAYLMRTYHKMRK